MGGSSRVEELDKYNEAVGDAELPPERELAKEEESIF
jgi:hypothetical protein